MTFPFALGVPGGGTGGYLQTARHLRAAGPDITLLPLITGGLGHYPRPPVRDDLSSDLEAGLREIGIDVQPVSRHPLHFALDGLATRSAVRSLMARRKIDAVLSWHHEAFYLGRFLRRTGIAFAMMAAGSFETFLGGRNPGSHLLRRMLGKSYRRADVVFPVSRYMCRQVVELFDVRPEKVQVAYCGVDPLFAGARRSPPEAVCNFLFFGMWIERKGIYDALRAFGQVARQGRRDFSLRIAGWGDEARVRQVAREENLLEHVRVLGKLDHRQLLGELEWADVAVLPSYCESFGLAVAEAQASGAPVIAYEIGAVPEVIEKDLTGWLVPKGRIDLLAESIVTAMGSPERTYRMGLDGRQRMTRLFSWQRTAEEILHRLRE